MAGYQKTTLSDDEKGIFDDEWDKFVTRHFKNREVQDIFQDMQSSILEACEVTKFQLDATFGGVNARTNEFGWTPIQPNFLLPTSLANSLLYAYRTWNQWLTSQQVTWGSGTTAATSTNGWLDWIGSSSSNLKLSKYACMIIIGFADSEKPNKIDALLAKIKGVDYPVWWMGDALEEQDYGVYELTSPFIIEKEQEIYIQERVGRAGLSRLRPLGVYFGKGDHLRSKTAYAQT